MYEIKVKEKVSKFINSQSNSQKLWEKVYMLKYFKSKMKLNLDVEKIQGKENTYRLRIGTIRIMFKIVAENLILVSKSDYRNRVYK